MGYDQPDDRSSSGAAVTVLVAVLLILVLGGVIVIGVGGYLWLRTARAQQQLFAELRRAEAEQARALAEAEAERLHAEAVAQIQRDSGRAEASNSQPDLTVILAEDGSLSVDRVPVDLLGLKSRLSKLHSASSDPISVHITVHPDSPHEQLIPVLEACHELRMEVNFRITPSDESESGNVGVPADRGCDLGDAHL